MREIFLHSFLLLLIAGHFNAARADILPFSTPDTGLAGLSYEEKAEDLLFQAKATSLLKHIEKQSRFSLLDYRLKPKSSGSNMEQVYISTEVFGSIKKPGVGLKLNVLW